MRPLFLKFAGIGSFPGKVEVDFNDLSAMGLYLIVGRTGAGKTTIFDAMTYALYGKVSADRENAIVSGHSNREAPFIEFTFEHAGLTYTAHREPALPGKTMTPNKQWLSTVDAKGVELNRITQTREVNNKVKEIIGLNDSEFMQVILLPQGKFQQFLVAKSTDKKSMLQAIFGTYAYRRIVDTMIESSRKLKADLEATSITISNQWAIVQNAHESLIDEEIFEELPDFQEDTEQLIRLVDEKAAITQSISTKANDAFAVAKTAQAQAQSEVERFDKAEEKKALTKERDSMAKTVETASQKVAMHDSAAPIAEAITARDALTGEMDSLTKGIQESRKSISNSARAIKISSDAMKKFSDAIPTATPTVLSTEFTKLENFLTTTEEKFEELAEVTEDIKGFSSEIESLTTSIAEANAISEKTAAELATVKSAIKDARASLKELPAITRQAEKLEELLELADESEALTAISKATKLRDKQKEKFDKLTANLKSEQDKRTRQLAGELADELNTGEECPVCGSLEHPKKAQKSSGAVDMESLSDKRDNQFELLKDAEQDLKEAQAALKTAQTAKAKLPTQAEQKALLKKYNSLQKLTEEEDLLSNKLLSLETTATSAAEQVNQEKQTLTAASTSIKTLKSRQTALKKQTDPIGSAKQLSDAIAILDDIRDALDELSQSVGALNDKQSQMKQADTAVKALLKKSTFTDEKTVKSALLNEDVLEEQQSIVHSAEQREITIGNLIAAIGEKPLPKKRPEVEALAEKVEASKAELEDAQHIHGIVKGALTDITKAFKEITKIGPAYAEKQRQAQSVASIATVFKDGTSKNAGGQLDLETWVLRTLFEEVCLVANDQMRQLSSNRYALTLDQEEGGVAKRRGGGLDIYVLDAQTGLTRPVQTMSGGEQFIASLALALALAEVVQRHAGGIEVPCLFIDEGFGGLDLETLDIAIDVLLKIQATGRSVGIITHVKEMQDLLPIGIRVHKGLSGSTLEVQPS